LPWLDSESNRLTFFGLLAPGPGQKILDVGAGWGAVADMVRANGDSEVHAVDPDRKRVERMREAFPLVLSCRADSEHLPYRDSLFDKLYSTMAFHHFPDRRKSLEEFARVLRPGGTLLIAEIQPHSAQGRFLRFFENGVMRSHLGFLDMEALVGMQKEGDRFGIESATKASYLYFVHAKKRQEGPKWP